MIKARNSFLNNASQSSKCPQANLTELLLLMIGFLFSVCAVNSNLIWVLPCTFNGVSYLLGGAGLFSVTNKDVKTKTVSIS